MAKNYTIKEAVEIISKGKDLEAITDIGRRYPVLAHKVAVVATKAGEDFVDFMSFMPEYLTANKVNAAIKAVIAGSDTADEADASEEADTADDETTDESKSSEDATWNESMSAKQLWEILGNAGKRKLAKSTKKADLIEACKKAFGDTGEDVDEDAEEDEAANPYEGKSAMELFKECKARKIKAAAKKPAKYYVELLVKNDEAAAAANDEDDDWDDEDEKSEAPKKETKQAKAKASKKEVEEDEDDDWDI